MIKVTNPDVSVIIVNYNSADLTINTINSVFSKTQKVRLEVIIVDNDSHDDSVNKLIDTFGNKIIVIKNLTNRGFGSANNIGAKEATGKYVFLLNPDTILLNNAIDRLFEYAESQSEVNNLGVIGGLLLDTDNNPNNYAGFFPSIKQMLYEGYHKDVKLGNSAFKVDYVSGADMFLKRKLYNLCGGFDRDFFMYFEETDLQRRLFDMGYIQMIVPDVKILHLDGGTFKKNKNRSSFRRYYYDESKIRYVRKHYSIILYSIFRILFFIVRFPALFNYHYKIRENINYAKVLIK